ncbi:PREDICTED: 60S acidic ribosomal protein P1-like [Ipomoea nil]|uniref:60S acidic ribosomal protein P1-like n=1 Tax=Ipomoea nil TaxID=35883 RepID=UPI0009011858|nr:PREDICTED: 60S acidic ribosomal protein P1-like [Ipomoea nil]
MKKTQRIDLFFIKERILKFNIKLKIENVDRRTRNDGIPVTAKKIAALVKSYWPSLFAKLCEKRNIEDLIMNVGAGGGGGAVAVATPAAEEKKEEAKEESDDDMGFRLFD